MKPTKVKAWPELIDFFPALPVLTDVRGEAAAFAPVEVDFGNVREVNSTGMVVFLLRLLRLLGPGRRAHVRHHGTKSIRASLQDLGAFSTLGDRLSHVEQADFLVEDLVPDHAMRAAELKTSLPVYRLEFAHHENRRYAVSAFVTWLTMHLPRLHDIVPFRVHGIVMLLNEIAKNSADHADADALFGVDAYASADGSRRLVFAFGDCGIGIKQHIERHLPPEEERRLPHYSLYEAYRLALKPGYTSNRTSGLNKGHGMSIILDTATAMGMHLSVFDAKSRGILTTLADVQKPTHSAIRRIFHNVGHDVGFFYYGELLMPGRAGV